MVLGGLWILASRVPEPRVGATSEGLETAPRKGFLAPDFTLTTLEGNVVRLSELRGKPVVTASLWLMSRRAVQASRGVDLLPQS